MLTNATLFAELEGLNRFALKLCKNKSDADDLVQTTIVRALSHKESFEDGTKAFSWLSRIMYNSFATAYKRKIRYESQYDPEPEILNVRFESSQEDKIMVREVQSAMEELCPQHREILMLICAYEMSYEEASTHLNIPVGTVRSRLSRARESLMVAMSGNDNHKRENSLSLKVVNRTSLH
ncbi:MAG TPA: RNA polymerase subunit sigma [Rhodospirillaceae bacterium]|nr:RNA polymerase subunit sigma [Rhodospirillaceae bacterium]